MTPLARVRPGVAIPGGAGARWRALPATFHVKVRIFRRTVTCVTDCAGTASYRSWQMQCEGIFAMTGSSDWLLVYSMLVIFGGLCATQILL